MSREDMVRWMTDWANRNGCTLSLSGTCGFDRDCVGVIIEGRYPSYYWYGSDYLREDLNGEVWVPEDAYHKCPCVAVLGHGESAERQLYTWLKWFDDNGFTVETGVILADVWPDSRYARLVKKVQ